MVPNLLLSRRGYGMDNEGSAGAPSIRAWGLHRSFGSGHTLTHVLRGISIELYPGQMTLLMGRSGSGKSTLLAVLSGLLKPHGGQVLALGQDLWRMSERQREAFRLRNCGF